MKPLSITHPGLIQEWHPNKNSKKISEVSAGSSSFKFWWICSKGHEWQSTIYNRTRKNGSNCPFCSHRKIALDGSNSLARIYPELAKLWDQTRNGALTPESVVAGGEKKYHWKCPRGNDHEWESSIHCILSSTNRYKGSGCPVCRGIKVVKSNSFATLFPELAKEWTKCISHPNKRPETVSKSSNVMVLWQCRVDKRHIFKASPNDRTSAGYGCPFCSGKLNKSDPELIILFELKSIFPDINPDEVSIPRLTKDYNTKQVWNVDIIVPFEKKPLIIEYDGEYAHKTKYRDNDVRKTEELIASGYNVIRLREGSLPKLNDKWDLSFPKISRNILKRRLEIKQIANQLLSKISEKYGQYLSEPQKDKISQYYTKLDLVNTDEKEKYVFKTLKGKVNERELQKMTRITIMPFEKARDFARSLKLKNAHQWKRLYTRNRFKDKPTKPQNIPSYPERVYKNLGWISYQDWLDFPIHERANFETAKLWIKNHYCPINNLDS